MFNFECVVQVHMPALLQEYIDHSSVLHKVYVAGSQVSQFMYVCGTSVLGWLGRDSMCWIRCCSRLAVPSKDYYMLVALHC